MAEYINIRGQSIEVVASDPANPTVGQIWYNSTSNTLKGGGLTTAGAWATGGNLNTARGYLAGQQEHKLLDLYFGGYTGTANTGATEEYDGSAWTTSTCNFMLQHLETIAGTGTQTAALGMGGAGILFLLLLDLQMQQKNMMVLLGHLVEI
jgi:hypothetical protein